MQEAHLVAIGLVGELKSRVDIITKPFDASSRANIAVFLRDGRPGQDACRLLLHVAMHYNGILGVAFIRINPVLTTRQLRMSICKVFAGLCRRVFCAFWFEELLE